MIYLQAPHPLSHTLTLPGVGPNRSFVLSFLRQTTLFPIPNAIPGKLIFNSPAFLLPLNSGYCLLLSTRASPCPARVFCTQNTPISLGFALPPSARQLMRPGQVKHILVCCLEQAERKRCRVQVGLMGSGRRKHLLAAHSC